MRLAVYSDLHLNCNQWSEPDVRDADLVIIPGDIQDGPGGITEVTRRLKRPVITVLGNHDFADLDIDEAEDRFRAEAAEANSTLLARDVLETEDGKGPIRLIGCTLWTDFACMTDNGVSAEDVMTLVRDWSSDYTDITRQGRPLSPADFVALFEQDRDWLEKELTKPFDGRTVVITHHGPSRRSIHPKYAESRYVPYYVADMEGLIMRAQPALWIHGHTHMSVDYNIGRTRIFANQLGTEVEPDRNNPTNPYRRHCIIDI